MSDIILELKDICKNFYAVRATENVSFTLKKGELLSLIGENGAGKSTIMNIIGGVIEPTAGRMFIKGEIYSPKTPADADRAGIAFIHQELNLFNNLSILDNMYITRFPKFRGLPFIKKKEIRKRAEEIISSLELSVSPDTLVEKLSPGERQLVEIAKAINSNPEVIIFDEPTTSLTNKETKKLFELIEMFKQQGKSIIYISHILEDVYRLSDDIIVLRDGKITDQGPVQMFTIDKMIKSMVGRELKQLYPEKKSFVSNEVALKINNLSQRGIVSKINFDIKKGEVLGIFGLMGAGRSELARLIFGIDNYEEGEIYINNQKLPRNNPRESIKKGIAFITENRREEGLFMELSILDNMGIVSLREYSNRYAGFVNEQKMFLTVSDQADQLRLKSENIRRVNPKSLSGGNQQKVVIGKWLVSEPEVLIVDEPTRGIDVGAKMEVYNIIRQLSLSKKSVLMISSELEELLGVCDRILVMNKGEITAEFINEELKPETILRSAFGQI